jgi:hypothetical protein
MKNPGNGAASAQAGRWSEHLGSTHVARWARSRGFLSTAATAQGGRPPVDVRRIRQTVIENRRRPIAQTRQTRDDLYLLPSPTVRAESQRIVAQALEGELAKARVPLCLSRRVGRRLCGGGSGL